MRIDRLLLKAAGLFLFIFLIIGVGEREHVFAAKYDEDEGVGVHQDHVSAETYEIWTDEGSVRITLTATTASSGTTWKTIGFYLSDRATGYNGISGNAGGVYRTALYFYDIPGVCSKNGTVNDVPSGGITTTTFEFDMADVQKALKASGIQMTDGKQMYFQGILSFWRNGAWWKGPFYTYSSAYRSSYNVYPPSSWAGWRKRYDIKIKLFVKDTKVNLRYYRKNTKADKASGATTTWTKLGLGFSSTDPGDKWTDKTLVSVDSLAGGNGLGFEKSSYKEGDTIHFSKYNTPRKLSQVKPHTGYENYYFYKISWSKTSDAVDSSSGVRPQHNTKTYTGSILNADGTFTDEYLNWVTNVRQVKYKVNSNIDGMVLNVFYKKESPPKEDPGESSESTSDSYMNPPSKAIIQSDNRGSSWALDSEVYDSTEGIPTSETQYVNVLAKDYLYTVQYTLQERTKTYTYHSGCTYTKPVYEEDGKTIKKAGFWTHSIHTITYTATWEDVESLGIWKLENVDVQNDSLPNGRQIISPGDGYSIMAPDLVKEGSVTWGTQKTLDCGGKGKPSKPKCKSGRLVFRGKTILDDKEQTSNGCKHTSFDRPVYVTKDTFFRTNLMIDPVLANGEYISDGQVVYRAVINDNTSYSNILKYDIESINDVVVHTPVVSYPTVVETGEYNAKRYCQLVSPDTEKSQLVLDRVFRVKNSSLGYHSDLRGYGSREYTVNTSKFISKKEVKFPFDVYAYSAGRIGKFYPQDTWIELDLLTGEGSFYLPIWVNEQQYSVEFRSRAINCDANVGTDEDALSVAAEYVANTDNANYLATANITVEVSGRMFDLSMYDYSDYPAWGDGVFRKRDSTELTGLRYTVGMKDRNGNIYRNASNEKYTFTLVNGSHPYLTNYGVMKPGYAMRFNLTTFGNMYTSEDRIEITPSFYYVSYDGSTRQRVNLYYDEMIEGKMQHFVKVGGSLDSKNVKTMSIGDLYASVPQEELEKKAQILGTSLSEVKASVGEQYTYGKIYVPVNSCTFVGDKYIPDGGVPDGVDATKVSCSAGKWYFQYALPANVHAVPVGATAKVGNSDVSIDEYAAAYGIDYSEPFWCSGGYIVVNWDIKTVATSVPYYGSDWSAENVNYHLSYVNKSNWYNGYCNMWNKEGFAYEKTDSSGHTYHFDDGDVLMFYCGGSSGGSVANDYHAAGTH